MTAFEVLLIAAEDVQRGDWIGEPTQQGRVVSVKPLTDLDRLPVSDTQERGKPLAEEWRQWRGGEADSAVEIFVVSAQSAGTRRHVVGRSLVALVGEPVRVTRTIAATHVGPVAS